MAGINNLLDASGDPKTATTLGGITNNQTVANKTWFDDGIFTYISAIVEHFQGGSSNSRIRSTADFSTTKAAVDSLPA